MNEAPDDETLLTMAETARLVKASTRTVERWEAAGLITSLRTPGNHRRFKKSDVLALLDSRESA